MWLLRDRRGDLFHFISLYKNETQHLSFLLQLNSFSTEKAESIFNYYLWLFHALKSSNLITLKEIRPLTRKASGVHSIKWTDVHKTSTVSEKPIALWFSMHNSITH